MKDINTNLLRHHEREERKENLKREEWLLNHPKVEDKVQARKNIDALKSQLDHLSPEPLSPAERDKLYKLEKRLAAKIQEGMPTDETMRKNTVGAVHQHRTWEKANKKEINWWKNIRIQLNPDSDDKDLANIERLRRPGQMDRMRTDAQISGVMSYGNVPEELWPFESPENTAAKQAERTHRDEKLKLERSLADAEHRVETREPIELETGKRKRHLSPERRQQLRDNLAIARKKRAENLKAGINVGSKDFKPVE
jgi:hypothetical protein